MYSQCLIPLFAFLIPTGDLPRIALNAEQTPREVSDVLRKGMLAKEVEDALHVTQKDIPALVNLCYVVRTYRSSLFPRKVIAVGFSSRGKNNGFRVENWSVRQDDSASRPTVREK